MKRINGIIGNKLLSIMQSKIKYRLNFRHDYYYGKKHNYNDNYVVFIIDDKTIHGGLSDRLRGLLSTYHYCLKKNKKLIVNWSYPFELSEYLKINTTKAEYGGYLSHNLNEVSFRFFNSYSFMNDDEESYFKLLDSSKPITHVYSNVTLHEELFCKHFNELFTPTERIADAIRKCQNEINGKYISVAFRFIGLLGDFNDTFSTGITLSDEQKTEYMEHCLNAIRKLHEQHKNISKILVTADSNLFLSYVSNIPYIYIVPGIVTHMDGKESSSQDKTFLDFFMISKAEYCYCYKYGKMFGSTKFARTAALIGGKTIKDITDDDF